MQTRMFIFIAALLVIVAAAAMTPRLRLMLLQYELRRPITVNGLLLDESGAPVSGAEISAIWGFPKEGSMKVVTDSAGRFVIRGGMKSGTMNLSASGGVLEPTTIREEAAGTPIAPSMWVLHSFEDRPFDLATNVSEFFSVHRLILGQTNLLQHPELPLELRDRFYVALLDQNQIADQNVRIFIRGGELSPTDEYRPSRIPDTFTATIGPEHLRALSVRAFYYRVRDPDGFGYVRYSFNGHNSITLRGKVLIKPPRKLFE